MDSAKTSIIYDQNTKNDCFINAVLFEYKITKLLGKGTYSKTYHANVINDIQIDHTNSMLYKNSDVAIKIINKLLLSNDWLAKQMRLEVEILKQISHKNICNMIDILQSKRYIYIVIQYASKGDLFEYIKIHGVLPELQSKKYFKELIEAVNYLHSNNIIHRDIKPENILINDSDNILLTDFGFSSYQNENDVHHAYCGSITTIAPEIIKNNNYCGKKSDIWSCGIVLYFLLNGKYPLTKSELKMNSKIDYSNISENAKDLLSQILLYEPTKRLTSSDILNYKWFDE